ncbi:L-lysine 6-monooxygenase [Burkholderia sp. Bp9090]|uniref:lysine N(6)-hydroxylase/L-ornithine N(5)-oxygenase family protein n=1 Tax=unclassified Burkholderia TaxID=2613784 RepID=UPI000F5F9E36|nr:MULTISPECIES: SidA/IucD/PvdA family monooxygenase [unclassified Burkholderia]RQZ42300.1 L-lysine 6-monooxygenase [Burkholderia sp. Bp9090]RQZ48234.1 L-lysine 6-monooxygenase [Burkholderia sp. Bp9099]
MRYSLTEAPMDVVGIGIGPANLSLAALLKPHPTIRSRFFDRRAEFQWHAGLMLPNAALQVSFLKDLVSLVDPTSALSFLQFLASQKRLLCFINANFPQVMRREFNQYYRWACEQLPNLEFNREVEAVETDGDLIVVHGPDWTQATRHLVLGTGQQPSVPDCAKPYLGTTLLHASQYLTNNNPVEGKRVVVIGGGQTGAEVFQHLISDASAMPASVTWASRRWNFAPLDESSFTNELYTPGYADYFYDLPATRRASLLAEQKLASDGVSSALLEAIYRRVYELRHVTGLPCDLQLRPARELVSVARNGSGWSLTLRHAQRDVHEALEADIVVLCTGYTYGMPACLDPIADRIEWRDDGFVVDHDYAIRWNGPSGSRIYVQNAARHQRGIADPNLGLIPWRCARIINSIAGAQCYDLDERAPFVHWEAQDRVIQRGLQDLEVIS